MMHSYIWMLLSWKHLSRKRENNNPKQCDIISTTDVTFEVDVLEVRSSVTRLQLLSPHGAIIRGDVAFPSLKLGLFGTAYAIIP
jgi:hypothetical protein